MAQPILKHADGTAVTAQEAHDAFMNTRLLIVRGSTTYETTGMVWYDNNSAQDDPTNVGFVTLYYVATAADSTTHIYEIVVGDGSLVPTAG